MGNISNNKNGSQITGRTGLNGSGNYLPLDLGSPGNILTIDLSSNITWATASSSVNFANTNLTFTGNRDHDTNGNSLVITTDGGGYSQSYFEMHTLSMGFGNNDNEININTSATTFNAGGNNVDFSIEGDTDSSLFFVDASSDNIGIGTNSPSYKIQVNGTVSTTGFRMTNGSSNGYVLTSDASGNATWQAPTSSSTSGIWGIPNTSGVYTYYSTLTLAMAAATSGQTIELFSDVTETGDVCINLKDGVNINLNGHTYKRTVVTATLALFRDNGVAVNCSIKNGILWNTSGGGASYGLIITGASNIDLTGTKIYVTGSATNPIYLSNSSAEVHNAVLETTLSVTCLYISSGKAYNITAKGTWRICELVSSSSFVYNSEFTSSGGNIALYIGGGVAINCTAINEGLNSGIWLVGGNAIDCVAYSTGIGININSLASSAINCTGYSSGNLGIQISSTGANLLQGCKAYSSASYGLNILGPVTNSIVNSTFFSSSAAAANSNPSGGTIRFENCSMSSSAGYGVNIQASTDLYNCVVTSTYNNVNGHSVVFSSIYQSTITGCVLRVTNSSANCLYSSSSFTAKYALNTYIGATTPVNANVTQGITNTTDSQGNILV